MQVGVEAIFPLRSTDPHGRFLRSPTSFPQTENGDLELPYPTFVMIRSMSEPEDSGFGFVVAMQRRKLACRVCAVHWNAIVRTGVAGEH